MSLVELMVTVFIAGILLAIVGSFFINVARVTANSNSTTSRSSVAANIMDAVSKVIRTASNNPIATSEDPDPAVVAATATGLTIISYVDTNATTPSPTKVTYRVDASGNLIEDRYASTATNNYWVFGTTAASRTVGGPILTPTGTNALFVYLDGDNQVIVAAGPIVNGNATLTLEQRESVASIKVSIQIANTLTTGSDPILLVNTVGMPNLRLSRTDN